MKVHCDEGVATHVAPDPCAAIREDDCEASVGERIGQPLSRESVTNSGADVVHSAEGKTGRRVTASTYRTRRGLPRFLYAGEVSTPGKPQLKELATAVRSLIVTRNIHRANAFIPVGGNLLKTLAQR